MANEYILTPNFDLPPPPDGPLQLGQILDNPNEPRYPLNSSDLVTPLDSKVYTHTASGVTVVRSQLETKEFRVWARLADLMPFGGESKSSRNKYSKDVFNMKTIETSYFLPTRAYVEASIKASKDTRHYIESGLWNKDVYMITGLKVVRGGSVTRVSSDESSTKGESSIDLTKMAVPVSTGAMIESSEASSEADHVAGLDPFVLAYQVQKIVYKKGKPVKIKAHSRVARLGHDQTAAQPATKPAANEDIVVVGLEKDTVPESLKSDDNWVLMASADGENGEQQDRIWLSSSK